MSSPKSLESIYIPLRLTEWVSPQFKESSPSIKTELLSLNEALERFERLTILGDAGSGKTTITSHAAAAVADRTSKINGKSFLPIFVPLRTLRDFLELSDSKEKSTKEMLCDLLAERDFADPSKYLNSKLDEGRCLIVLDGLDELADKHGTLQQRLSRKVASFASAIASGNRIIITSRAAGYEPGWFPGFRVLEMIDLTLEQIQRFVHGWFGRNKEELGNRLAETIAGSERLQLVLVNPLARNRLFRV